jgi:hypothetical protein
MKSFLIGCGYIVAFALIFELGSFTAYKINDVADGTRVYGDVMERSGLYEGLDLEKLMKEVKSFHKETIFDPYRSFRNINDFHGDFFNTDHLGRRITKGQFEPKTKGEVVIGIFGGSTLFGIGAESDLHTIPSLLFSKLNKKNKKAFFRVFNYGVGAYNNSQEMIYLIESLRSQNLDIAIFYDFVNESLHAYREAKFENQIPLSFLRPEIYPDAYNSFMGFEKGLSDTIIDFYYSSYSSRMIGYLRFKLNLIISNKNEYQAFSNNEDKQKKINRAVDNYRNNIKIIKSLGKHFNFNPIFILQPTLFTKNNLSDFESTIKHLKLFDYIDFEKELYKKVKLELVGNGLVEDFSDIFSDRKDTIYFDDHHMSSRGNDVIAHRMVEMVLKINQN